MNSAPRLRIESALTATPHRARASRWQTAAGLLGVTLLGLALAGCASLGGGGARPASLERAETLARRGDAAAAAREYAALAEDNSGVDAQNYQLRAAEQWLAAGQPDQARQAISALEGNLATEPAADRALITAEIALLTGLAPQGWATLEALPENQRGGPRAARYLGLRQRLAFATGRPTDGVRAQIARERLLAADAERLASRRELYGQLRDAAGRGIKLEPAAAAGDLIVRGWLEIGLIAAAAERAGGAGPAIASWRARFPGHPAGELVKSGSSDAGSSAGAPLAPGAHVALLLPVSGRTAAASAQIRDGVLAGLLGLPAGSRPALRVYDTAVMPVADALSEAARAGAEFVIGPLTREEVTAAADAQGRRPTLLALNFLPTERGTPAPADFYQFALSPEDEARLAARRAIADGRRRAVALVPAGDWGTRVLAAFREQLEADGGQLLGSAVYVPGQADFSRPIQSVLRLSDSQARRKRLESLIGSALTFQPRRRGDIDCIFVPAPAAAARALRPQLRFHFAGDIPAYATSDAYEPGLAANQDLDGLIFPETPWLLGSGEAASRLRAAQRDAWGADAPSRGRLFAFGYDAFQLYSALRAGKPSSANELQIDGATGLLSLDSERRVHRELTWAQIGGGAARVLAVTKVP